jgi:hypothetical protein
MNHSPLTFAVLFAAALPAGAQLTLNQVGGAIGGGNYGTQGSTSAFGFDEIGAGTIPIHKIPNIRDGVFGNGNSWIGDSPNSFVGLNFGATAVPVGQVAWGRDNTGNFFDRTAGTYTVHYTQVPSPGTALPVTGDPATGWATIGSVNYLFAGAAGSPLSMSSRHVWGFPSVNATGIRVTAPGSSFADGACIDELEAYTFAAAPLSLVTAGGSMNVSTNLALTGTAFAKDLLAGGGFAAHSNVGNLNDGIYGNGDSWIGDSESSFAGLSFSAAATISSFAFGRDNTGTFGDRSGGTYTLQYTTVAAPDALTPDSSWTTIGSIYYDHDGLDSADRHEYSFAPVTATGIRLFAAGNGIGTGRAIDELEVYAIPEPGASLLMLGAAAGLLRRRRK